jgi:hypothetical protein
VATPEGGVMSRRLNRAERALIYGLAGWCSEVVSTGIRSRGRDKDWRLSSHTYLWMLPVYGLAAVLFEPAYDAAKRAGTPWWGRALMWTGGIYAVEAASGEAIRSITGEVPWDYSRPRGVKPVPAHWRGLVRPAYAPVWFAVGLGMEQLHDLLRRVEVAPHPE